MKRDASKSDNRVSSESEANDTESTSAVDDGEININKKSRNEIISKPVEENQRYFVILEKSLQKMREWDTQQRNLILKL